MIEDMKDIPPVIWVVEGSILVICAFLPGIFVGILGVLSLLFGVFLVLKKPKTL